MAADLPDALREFLAAPPPGHFDNYGDPPSLVDAIDVLVSVDEVSPARMLR